MVLLPAQIYSPESEYVVERNFFRHSFLLVPVQGLDHLHSICFDEPDFIRVGSVGSGYPSTTHVRMTESPYCIVVLLAVSLVVLPFSEEISENGTVISRLLVSFRGKLHLICLVLMWVN